MILLKSMKSGSLTRAVHGRVQAPLQADVAAHLTEGRAQAVL